MNNLKKIKLPLIVTDMDGVIIHNVYPLPKVKDTLKLLQKPLGEINNI
jgi:ribonucleotide monophosphatase NagD (HAD superfamily)